MCRGEKGPCAGKVRAAGCVLPHLWTEPACSGVEGLLRAAPSAAVFLSPTSRPQPLWWGHRRVSLVQGQGGWEGTGRQACGSDGSRTLLLEIMGGGGMADGAGSGGIWEHSERRNSGVKLSPGPGYKGEQRTAD